jgi:hypothetical protein
MFYSLFQVSTDTFGRFVRLPLCPCEMVLQCVSNLIFHFILLVIQLNLNVQCISLRQVKSIRSLASLISAVYVECEIQSLDGMFLCICYKMFTVALLCVHRPMYSTSC